MRPLPASPWADACGLGVNSTAKLIGFEQRGLRPDLILFADTGGEKPETYDHKPALDRWLESVGFPPITVVRYRPLRTLRGWYETLEGQCLVNETLPSLAFGYSKCSLKWKRGPQDRFCASWQPAIDAWARGKKVLKTIGFDAGPRDRERTFATPEDKLYRYWYPLIEWGWDREECKRQIEAAGLPVPPKSACFFCPASKKHEVAELAREHPDLLERAIAMEDGARHGRHGLRSTVGLGRRWSWREFVEGLRRQRDLFEKKPA